MSFQHEINNANEELRELEELISLQKRKVQLLHVRHDAVKKTLGDKYNESPCSNNTIYKTFTLNPKSVGSGSDRTPIATSILTSKSKQDYLMSSMQRMSRLSTELANERNLLGWGTTALAAASTAIAFLGLTGTSAFGDSAVYVISVGFAVLAVWMGFQGVFRYRRIKEILMLPEPPLHFDRISNVPIQAVLLLLLILLVIGNFTDQWSK